MELVRVLPSSFLVEDGRRGAGLTLRQCLLGASVLPGNPLYPAKRAGEGLIVGLTPNVSYKNIRIKGTVRGVYGARRLSEAEKMIERLDKRSVKKQISDADTIEALLQQFNEVFSDLMVAFSQSIDRGEYPSEALLAKFQKPAAEKLVKLVHLRLEVPPTVQAALLRSITIVNRQLATMADSLRQPPISKDDAIELSKMVGMGLISKDEMDNLMSQANSNRRLLEELRERVKTGQLPTGIIYAMNYDLITKELPAEAPGFIHTVRFDELRKVALLMKTVEPSPAQKQAIDDYLKSYKPGDRIPTNSVTRYTVPLIYGWHLVEVMGVDTSKIDPEHVSAERRIFYDLWSPVLGKAPSNSRGALFEGIVARVFAQSPPAQATSTPAYDKVMSATSVGMLKSSALLDRVQLELLKALRGEVAYMALPPGWTAADVAAMSDSFAQSVDGLRSAEAVQAKTSQAVTALSALTVPLQPGLSNEEADKLRIEMKTAIEQLRTNLVQNVYATVLTAGSPTAPATSVSPAAPIATTNTITIEADTTALEERFNKALAELEAKLTAGSVNDKATAAAELSELKKDFAASISGLRDSQALLEDQVKAQAALLAAAQAKIDGLQAGQGDLAKAVAATKAEAADANKATASRLDTAIATLNIAQRENVASLQSQLDSQKANAVTLELSLISLAQSQLEQKSALKAEIELSAADRTALKVQVETAVTELKADQAKNLADLNTALAAAEARGDAKIAEAKVTINELKTTQSDIVQSLQSLGSNQNALQSQVTSAITRLEAAQDSLNASVSGLTTNQANLTTVVAGLQTSQAETYRQLQAATAETANLRTDLEQAIASVTTAQTAATTDLNTAILALGSQLSQSIATVSDAQAQTRASLELVDAKTISLETALAGIVQVNLEARANLEAELAETQAIQTSLGQSLATLSQSLAQTAGEVAILQTDTNQLKQSVTNIANSQIAAQAQIDSLIAASVDWANTAAAVKVDLAALEALQANLETSFAAKSVQLQVQFETYQQQMNDGLTRLTTHTDEQILRLQQETERLKLLLEQAAATTTTTASPDVSLGL